MKLSEKTLNVLRNYATINPSIKILEGNTIATIAETKNILSKTTVEDSFPQDFGIYDLNNFISTLSLVDEPNLKFDEKFVTIFDSTGRSKIKYFFDNTQEKGKTEVVMPEAEVQFTLTADTLASIKKAAATLGHDQLVITDEGGNLELKVCNVENTTSNAYTIDVGFDEKPDVDFNFIFNISNLKMIPGDYEVSISSKLISNFKHTTEDLEYFIAVERTSTYG